MEIFTMKRMLVAMAVLCSALMSAQAASQIQHAGKRPHQHRGVPDASHSVTYNKDSPNPAIGWHWENGMRVCHNDCDNDEIPGSGFTCSDVTVMGQAMRQCSRQN
jgi:hypothetical protein